MAIKDVIAAIRKEASITQEEMARRLYVTRQCVSRWEQGETTPGIDMVKLICVTFGVPLERFFDMPMSYYCQCCSMPIPDEEMHGTEADGSRSADFCKYCYDHGDFTAKGMTMDEFIEATAPMEAKALGVRSTRRSRSWPLCCHTSSAGARLRRTRRPTARRSVLPTATR